MILGRRAFFAISFLVCCLLPDVGLAQFSKIKDIYQDGEDFFQAEDYKEAIFYFLQVEEKGFVSSNLKYKIGICYLNLPGEETRAIPYLEEAARHVSLKYSPKTIQERQAPLHTLYYLGNAYRIDNQLSKALDAYRKFTAHPGYDGNYNLGVVESEIRACERAKIIQD